MSEKNLLSVQVTPQLKARAGKELKESVELIYTDDETYLVVVAIDKSDLKNNILNVYCKAGIPIGGYVYDSQSDCYPLKCTEILQLGYIPASYFAKMPGVGNWKVRVPMPENVLKKYLSSMQKKELKGFISVFGPEEYDIQFIQMINPN